MFFRKNKKTAQARNNSGDPKKQTKGKRSLITGIIVGGAVGSVLSLLFAPRKGTETRKKVYKTSKDLYEGGRTKAEEFLDKYKNKVKDKIDE